MARIWLCVLFLHLSLLLFQFWLRLIPVAVIHPLVDAFPSDKSFGSRLLNLVPTLDSISNYHDDWLDEITKGTVYQGLPGTAMPDIINYGTFVPSAINVWADIGLTSMEYYPWANR